MIRNAGDPERSVSITKGLACCTVVKGVYHLRALQGRQICVKNSFFYLYERNTRTPEVIKETHRAYAEEFTTLQHGGI